MAKNSTVMGILNQAHRQNNEAMPKFTESLKHVFTGENVDVEAKADAFVPGYNRRGFLRLGGLTIVGGAALAACGSDSDDSSGSPTGTGGPTGTDGPTGGNETDITVARTAASLENLAIAVYQAAVDNAEALGLDATVGAAAGLFIADHQAHADAFNGVATSLGGEAYTEASPVGLEAFADTIAAVQAGEADQAAVLTFAHDLELVAADTYVKVGVPLLSTAAFRAASLSVGMVEQLHATAIAALFADLGLETTPASGFRGGKEVGENFFV